MGVLSIQIQGCAPPAWPNELYGANTIFPLLLVLRSAEAENKTPPAPRNHGGYRPRLGDCLIS
jgi:hypothetical protein